MARAPSPACSALALSAAGEGARATEIRNALQALTGDVVDQVAHAAGVSPLVVVPGDHLDAVAADHHGQGASTIEERESPLKSDDTSSCSS